MNNKLKLMVSVSLLISMEVVLNRFCSIRTPIVTIGLGFVPIAICAMLYGPVWAGLTGALADILGAALFPIGPFFPGFTVSAALTGVVFGLFLFKRKGSRLQLAGAVAVNCLIISLLLSTFWLTFLSGSSFFALLPPRIVQNLIMFPVQFTILRLLQKPVAVYTKKQIA